MIEVTNTVTISAARLCDLFTTAFEGGVTYWMQEANPIDGYENKSDVVWWGNHDYWVNRDLAFEVLYDDPDQPEGNEQGRKEIRLSDIAAGLALAAKNEPRHFTDFIKENEDSITADVLVQLIVLGDVIYG